MAAHKIRHNELLLPRLFVQRRVARREGVVKLMPRLAHKLQYPVGHMLRRNLQPPAYMILYQGIEERIALVIHNVVIPYAGADEHLLYSLNMPKLFKQLHIVAVVSAHLAAWFVA